MTEQASFPGLLIQDRPRIYVAAIPGPWLLRHTTPSWRIDDPETGFQRVVSERRTAQIASAVLDQRRTFPNAIVLATDSARLTLVDCILSIPPRTKFLVVDGQHRLYAQKHSTYHATFTSLIHVGLSEPEMAALFVEINDNQKRVPSSLRWDLVRLVRPEADPLAVRAADLVEGLNSEERSPLRQRIDMTGEQPEIKIKQGSLAPEIKILLNRPTVLREEGLETQLEVLIGFFAAVRERDPDGWHDASSNLYRARVFRALLKLLPRMLERIGKPARALRARDFVTFVKRIRLDSLADEKLRATHGNAGVAAIARTLTRQILR